MKRYEGQESLSYFIQSHTEGNLNDIFRHMLHKIGGQLLEQIYEDFPECFTQENQDNLMQTLYRAEVFVVTREEAHILNLIAQRRS